MADEYLQKLETKLSSLEDEKKEISKKINLVNKEIRKHMEKISLQATTDTLSAKLAQGKTIVCFPFGYHWKYMKKHKLRDFFNDNFERIEQDYIKCNDINIDMYHDGEEIVVDAVTYSDLPNNIAKCCPIHGNLDIFSFIKNENEWRKKLYELAEKNRYCDESHDLIKNLTVDQGTCVPALLEFFVSK